MAHRLLRTVFFFLLCADKEYLFLKIEQFNQMISKDCRHVYNTKALFFYYFMLKNSIYLRYLNFDLALKKLQRLFVNHSELLTPMILFLFHISSLCLSPSFSFFLSLCLSVSLSLSLSLCSLPFYPSKSLGLSTFVSLQRHSP